MRFAGVGAHHHNGIAERNIRTLMAIARTMMLHAAIHWPAIADATLWPLAVNHVVFLVNHVPNLRTGLCPADLFTKTRWEQRKLNNLHVWGCPVYVLDKMISDGKKLPRWTPRSTRTINMGFSPKHAITVPIVLNPQTGYITPQFHVVFDDWFATVPASVDDLPNFNADSWKRMFCNLTYQYILDNKDQKRLIVETENFEKEQDILSQQQRIATAIDEATPPAAPPVEPPTPPAAPPVEPLTPVVATQRQLPVDNETTQSPFPLPQHLQETQPPTPTQLFQSPLRPAPPDVSTPVSIETNDEIEAVTRQAPNEQQRHSPRRSTRTRKAPDRLGYDGRQGRGYLFTMDDIIFDWLLTEAIEDSSAMLQANKASVSDPDTLSFKEAMSDVENIQNWMKSCRSRNQVVGEKWDLERSTNRRCEVTNPATYLGLSA
ncbi:hypothetical protein MHU86_25627 [Fragilaria crotonensis]|nr:hypothetical protein MHU86_25627 [Fragilaria crotonensis]